MRDNLNRTLLSAGLLAAAFAPGCAFDRYKEVEIISEPPGARIEINGDFVGCAPTVVRLKGEPDGETELNYTIRAYPAGPEYYPQVKVFRKQVGEDDPLPKRLYFDMRVRQPGDDPPSTQPRRQRPWP